MIKKYIVWKKIEKYMYKQVEYNDKSMNTLAIFLNDGIGFKPYVNFLENQKHDEFSGNISWLQKHGKFITIEIDDYVYPNMPPFITTINNLLTMLKKYKRLFYLEVNRIEITLEDDLLTISGD